VARADDNRALNDLDALVKLIQHPSFYEDIRAVITRTRFTSGKKVHHPNELGNPKDLKWANKPDHGCAPRGTTPPIYGDVTGEDAVFGSEQLPDPTGKVVAEMQAGLSKWLTMAQWILDLANTDPEARALHTTPDCLGCGRPCFGGARKGLCDKCRKLKKQLDPIDRWEFIWLVRRQKQEEEEKKAQEEATKAAEAEAKP
jgi:hypothetical protein